MSEKLRSIIIAIAAVVCSMCGPIPPMTGPADPPDQCLAPILSPPGIYTIELDGVTSQTADTGYHYQVLKPGVYTLKLSRDGFVSQVVTYAAQPLGHCDTPIAMLASRKLTGEAGALVRRDQFFVTQDGRPWIGRGISDFLLFDKFLRGEGLDAILNERVDLGRNYVRVFGTLASFGNPASKPGDVGHLFPQEHADYFDKLAAFADYLALFGMRLEFVIFADGQIVMPDAAMRRAHADRVVATLAGHWNANTVEYANEPFKNLPGGDREAADEAKRLRGRGVYLAAGDVSQIPFANIPAMTADYGTHHQERKPEWPRGGKDIFDLAQATHAPYWTDEPMGASGNQAAVDRGSRSNVPSDFLHFAATATLFGSALFHCDSCVLSELLGPVERSALVEFDFAQHWIPREAQTWPYQRGDNCGDCPGVGDMPIAQWDLPHAMGSLRSFCKSDGVVAYCDASRPADNWTAIARGTWRVVEQPRRGLVKLTR